MIAGEIGLGEYQYKVVNKFVGHAPVKGTNWFVGVVVTKDEVLSELGSLQVSVMVSSIVFILIGLSIIYMIANSITKGIKATSKHLELLAEEVASAARILNDMTNQMMEEVNKFKV